jgi:radical SAM superfamily enzyme YgiQ (UPF0313 family)
LDCVAAAISDRHKIRVVDLLAEGDGFSIESAVTEFRPQVVGISLRNVDNTDITSPMSFVDEYRDLVARIRTATNAPIVLGGSGFTIFSAPLMRMLEADFGIAGRAELFSELLDRFEMGRNPAGIPGLLVRGSDGAPPSEPRSSFSPRPAAGPVRHVDPTYYIRNGGMLNLQTKRGCPYRCSYCTYPNIEGHELQPIDPAEVARTARALELAGARYLFVTDSTFNCSIGHNLAVADSFKTAGLSIPWGAFFAPVRTPAEYYRRLAAAGLTHVEFGTEALNDVMLRSYRKPFAVDDVFREHEKAVEAGLNVAHYFMLGGPDESPATLAETLGNVQRLPRTVSFFFCGVRIYPGTQVHQRAVSDGLIREKDDILEPVYYRSAALAGVDIEALVHEAAAGRSNWVVGAGGERTMKLLERMYARGHVGPLWEKLAR